MLVILGWLPRLITNKGLLVVFALATCFSLCGVAAATNGEPSSRVYPATAGEPLSHLFAVSVQGQSSPVYPATVGSLTGPYLNEELTGTASFTSFDLAAPVQIVVTYAHPVERVAILPKSRGIVASISGNDITFIISRPDQLTVEVNGAWNDSLHLFANAFENSPPSPSDPGVLYYGPGIHVVQNVRVSSGQTVYLAEGAILYGRQTPGQAAAPLFTLHGSNIVLRGRGIIDGSGMPRITNGGLIYARGSGIQIEGITLRDSGNWTLHVNEANNVQISNIKVFGWRLNSDGTDIDSSQNVQLNGSFYRTYDDLISVKTNNSHGMSSNILVKNCVLWNEKAHALIVGPELNVDVDNVLFTDLDIIHDKGHDWLLETMNYGSAAVTGVSFENLNVEESMLLMQLYVGGAPGAAATTAGSVNGVIFRNIAAAAPSRIGANVDMEGFSGSNELRGIVFDNVNVAGAKVQQNAVEQNQFVAPIAINP